MILKNLKLVIILLDDTITNCANFKEAKNAADFSTTHVKYRHTSSKSNGHAIQTNENTRSI